MRTFALLPVLASLAAAGEARLVKQEVELTLHPDTASFESVVRIEALGPGRIVLPERVEATWERGGPEVSEGPATLVVRLRGVVDHPIQESASPTWVAGDVTAGTIGPRGTYLVSGFYLPAPSPCLFDVSVTTPLPHRAVSQGRRLEEREEEGRYRVRYTATHPRDALAVVAGPWAVHEERIAGAVCRTYLYEPDRKYEDPILATLREEVPRFTALFGPLPEGRFDVVENFFTTGLGFPDFTLIGEAVIRYRGERLLREGKTTFPAGYLDHELVHVWLGNHLLVDHARGNWCEALTTYFTNYGASERDGTDAAYRARTALKYSLRVDPASEYPLREFRSKTEKADDDIGYGKGSMVFHMLARKIGRETLAAAVRRAIETRGGRALGWDDLVEALSEGCGEDLRGWFEPWLARPGAPVLEAGIVRVEGTTLWGTILQAHGGPPYPLEVPVRVTTASGVEEHLVASASRETPFRIVAKAEPRLLEIDPDHHVFRRVPRERAPPCLLAVLTAPRAVGFGDEELLASLGVERIEPALPADAAIFAIGVPGALREAIARDAARQEPTLRLAADRFELRGVTYDRPGDGLLLAYARPGAPPVAFFHGNGPEAFGRTRALPYYEHDGFVVFRDALPVARGTFGGDRATRAELSAARRGEPEPILRDLFWLADPAHAGRRAGTAQSYNLANALRGRLHQAGLAVVPWPPVAVPDARVLRGRSIVLVGEEAPVRLEGCFYPFHRSASPQSPPVFRRVVEADAEDVRDAIVLLPEEASDDEAARLAEKGAAAVAVVASDAAFTRRGKEAAWNGALPPSVEAEFQERGLDPSMQLAGPISAGRRARLPVPYLYLAREAADRLRRHGREGTIEYLIAVTEPTTSNLVGVLGEASEPGILLSAHYDGLGLLDGVPAEGAADNAAGVACVLWVAERLAKLSATTRLRRPVVVALFGAEEMGLLGSTQFAAIVASGASPIAKPLAAVNLDGIGSHADREVFLVGRTHAPNLLARFERALEGTGLRLGRDIDRFAFERGSDHWPLHRIGVPAVTVFSADYRAMNTSRDTIAAIDAELVRATARAALAFVRSLATAETLELP